MDRPDAESVAALSKVDFGVLGYSVDDGTLQAIVDQADAYVEWVTGQTLDSAMPSGLVAIAEQAVRMRTEQIAFQAQEDYIEGATDETIQSFSAGSYSETRRDPTRRGEQKMLNAWQALTDILWMLMTPDKYDYWLSFLSGVHAPAFEVTEVAWSSSGGFVSADVPWLVEPRGSLAGGDLFIPGAVDLNSWSW